MLKKDLKGLTFPTLSAVFCNIASLYSVGRRLVDKNSSVGSLRDDVDSQSGVCLHEMGDNSSKLLDSITVNPVVVWVVDNIEDWSVPSVLITIQKE